MTMTLRFRDETIHRTDVIGDNHHMTWAADDRLLSAQCDGYGAPGPNGLVERASAGIGMWNIRLLSVAGRPDAPEFAEVVGYPDLTRVGTYYGFGTFSVGESVYVFLSNGAGDLSAAPWSRVKLIQSHDNGVTWLNQDGSTPVVFEQDDEKSPENMLFFEEEDHVFSHLAALQMGRGYEHGRDGYLYLYGTVGFARKAKQETYDVFLARVPLDAVADRARYEFFAGRAGDGSPRWSADLSERSAVCTSVQFWFPSVSYIPAHRRYLMINGGDGDAGFGAPSYFGAWTSETPWGPWTQIYEDRAWLPDGVPWARCYQARICPKWIADDGSHFWLVWSDFGTPLEPDEVARLEKRWEELRDPLEGFELLRTTRPNYRFNIQRVDIVGTPD